MARPTRACLGCKFIEESKRRAKPMQIVILSHPDTPTATAKQLADLMLGFAERIGRNVKVIRKVRDNQVPPGQVYLAGADEPWVKDALKTGARATKTRTRK